MNGYICIYKGKRKEVEADTIYAAQIKGAAYFNAKKAWEVVTMLAEKNGEEVIHTPMD